VNWYDWFLLILAVIFVIEGVTKGLTRVVIGLGATLLGLFLAAWFYPTAAELVLPYVSHPSLAKFLGFLLVFVLVQLLGALVAWALTKLWKVTLLTWLDRLLGGCFGLFKAALIGVVLTMVLMAFPRVPVPLSIGNSRLAPYLIEASHVLTALVPREMKQGFGATYEQVKKFWLEHSPGGQKLQPTRDSA
jgi:membrane protein required for colicin V production